MQKARRHSIAKLRPLVSAWFQGLFTPLLAVLFTFPSQYWFAIGLSRVFSLAGWCRQIHTGFLRSRATQDTNYTINTFGYGILTLYDWPSHAILPRLYNNIVGPTTPICIHTGLGFSAFARHYSRNHFCFLLLLLLRCFSSEGLRIFNSSSNY
jgi:hypothetical protein